MLFYFIITHLFLSYFQILRAGVVAPSSEELRYQANTVELYVCDSCHSFTRFPRYNHPAKLLCMPFYLLLSFFSFCCFLFSPPPSFSNSYISDTAWEVWGVGQCVHFVLQSNREGCSLCFRLYRSRVDRGMFINIRYKKYKIIITYS